jgi:hypothetical protein
MKFVRWINNNKDGIAAFGSIVGGLVYIIFTGIFQGSDHTPQIKLAFEFIVITCLLFLCSMALFIQKSFIANIRKINNIRWVKAKPSSLVDVVMQTKAVKVYFVSASLGHTTTSITELMHVEALKYLEIEVYCPDPNKQLLPSHALLELNGNLGTIKTHYNNNHRIRVYGNKWAPSIGIIALLDKDNIPVYGFLNWYSIKETNKVESLEGRGQWGLLSLPRNGDDDAKELLNRAYQHIKTLEDDPDKILLIG